MSKKKEETRNIKKTVLIVVAILALIGAVVLIIMTVKKPKNETEFKIDGIDIIEDESILKDTTVEGLDITNQVLYNRDNLSTFGAIINNKGDSDYYIKELYVIFTIEEETNKLLVVKDSKIAANDQKVINLTFDKDMLKTTKIEYELIK